MVKAKRIYDPPAADDGTRILVDRLWPRGLTKEHARIDEWLKEIAPSNELRKWFGHDPVKWAEVRSKYLEELRRQGPLLEELKSKVKRETVTLLFAAKDTEHNNAVVLKELLD